MKQFQTQEMKFEVSVLIKGFDTHNRKQRSDSIPEEHRRELTDLDYQSINSEDTGEYIEHQVTLNLKLCSYHAER